MLHNARGTIRLRERAIYEINDIVIRLHHCEVTSIYQEEEEVLTMEKSGCNGRESSIYFKSYCRICNNRKKYLRRGRGVLPLME